VSLGLPRLDRDAFHGLPGLVVEILEPHTEADSAALLVHFLAMFGNAAGAGPHVVQDANQPARINAVVVGDAAFGRKGTAANAIERLMRYADPDWANTRILRGAQSAEAIIAEVDDDRATDRRLLVFEHEYGRLLAVLQRRENLSDTLKLAYDGARLQVRTKERDGWRTATRAHISVIGHVTPDVLGDRLSVTELGSGFGNRFLYALVGRSKQLPRGGRLSDTELDGLAEKVADALEFANEVAFAHVDPISARLYDHFGMQPQVELERTDAFWQRWEELYDDGPLNQRLPGIVGIVLERASTHVLRLAVCYALADCSKAVDRPTSTPPMRCGGTAPPRPAGSSGGSPTAARSTRSCTSSSGSAGRSRGPTSRPSSTGPRAPRS
jgi:hypothetical protein